MTTDVGKVMLRCERQPVAWMMTIALGTLALIGLTAARQVPAAQRWEYTVAVPSNIDIDLNGYGAQGWELVQVVPGGPTATAWIFKRPKP